MKQSKYNVSGKIEEREEQSLIQLARKGNLDAFTTLYEFYLPTVYKRIWYSIPRQDVDDVTQNVFISVLKSIRKFRGESKFSTWLRTITNRQIANYYRKGKQTKEEMNWSDVETNFHQNPNHLGDFTREEEMIFLRQGLGQLKDDYQDVILLRFADGLKFSEIAELKGKSLEAIKSQFRRAIFALRSEIGDTGD